MKSTKALFRITFSLFLFLVLSWLLASPSSAQGNKPLEMQFVAAGGGPPSVVVLGDGTVIFKITALESTSGALTGSLTEKITQVYPLSAEDGLLPITTTWKLQTADGTIEGYYAGQFQHMNDGTHFIIQNGEVLSVTGSYAGLYQAKVSYQALLLADHMTISGIITIHPREK